MAGQEDVIGSPGTDARPLVECEAESARCACEPLAQGTPPRLTGFWRVCEDDVCSCRGARCLSTHLMFGIRPVEADQGSQCFVRFLLHGCSPKGWYRGAKGQASLWSAKA